MAPIIHAVRHAQALHNLCRKNHTIHDPLLTKDGNEQCANLQKAFPKAFPIDLVVASPLRRTIYTALESFGPVLESREGMKIIALPELQETSDEPCDTGSDPAALRKEFAGKPVDFTFVQEGWNSKEGQWAPKNQALIKRARYARRWLKARPEKHIVLVSHGGFLHYLTEDWEDMSPYQGTCWENTEYRSYTFTDEIDNKDLEGYPLESDNATLTEKLDSRQRRQKNGPVPSREQLKSFYKFVKEGCANNSSQ